MPKTDCVPAYRHHKATGQARVILGGKHHYLGRYGSGGTPRVFDGRGLGVSTDKPRRWQSLRACHPTAMLRTARVAPGGMVFHVLNPGVARMQVFEKVGDYPACLTASCALRHPDSRAIGPPATRGNQVIDS
jgi:hypothetical protein